MPTHEAQLPFEVKGHVEVVMVLRKLLLRKVEGSCGMIRYGCGEISERQ